VQTTSDIDTRAAAIEEAHADLRARADRAEADADALRAELARARADSGPAPGGDAGSTRRPRRRTGRQEDQPA
jgi:hypothetical protein